MRRSNKHCRIYIGSQNSSTNPDIPTSHIHFWSVTRSLESRCLVTAIISDSLPYFMTALDLSNFSQHYITTMKRCHWNIPLIMKGTAEQYSENELLAEAKFWTFSEEEQWYPTTFQLKWTKAKDPVKSYTSTVLHIAQDRQWAGFSP